MSAQREKVAVVGLGYVGLPVAVGFAREFPGTVGFDIDQSRINELRAHQDRTREFEPVELAASSLTVSDDPSVLANATFYIITVPTPIDDDRRPDLGALRAASRSVAPHLKHGDIVVYESTVYPGATEEVCGPILEAGSGLKAGVDFSLGYSPERINPGDRDHRLESITKVVSGDTPESLARVAAAYGAVVHAGIHQAPSIKVAEAAKVIENTQRDLNIALMNELATIFDRMGISTRDVLDAASTKWNFLRFSPGLVGGHCIGVDPYYLMAKAERLGLHPQVITAGRRINDSMGAFVGRRTVELLADARSTIVGARVVILGLTFKEDVPDLRNSRVPDVIAELRKFGIEPLVHDPLASPAEALHEYGITLAGSIPGDADVVILAVPHREYLVSHGAPVLAALRSVDQGLVVDIKARLERSALPAGLQYWEL